MVDESRTVWCGNLSDKVTEELLYELFLQVAPLERVRIPTDKDGRKSNFAFITMKHEVSVDYVVQILSGTSLYNRRLNIRPRNSNSQQPPPQRNEPRGGLSQSMMIENFQDLVAMGHMMQLSYNDATHGNSYNDRRRNDFNNKPYGRYQNNSKNDFHRRENNRNSHHSRSGHRNNDRNKRPRNYY